MYMELGIKIQKIKSCVFSALAIGILLLGGARAFAEIYLEPNMGYSTSTFALKYNGSVGSVFGVTPSTGQKDFGLQGPSFGFRFANVQDWVFLGADVRGSYLQDSGIRPLWFYSVGIVAGFAGEYIPFRFYIVGDLMNKYEGADFNAPGIRLGLGYYVKNDIMLNLEYQNLKATVDNTDSAGNKLAFDAQHRVFTVNLSIPMSFSYPEMTWKERRAVSQQPTD